MKLYRTSDERLLYRNGQPFCWERERSSEDWHLSEDTALAALKEFWDDMEMEVHEVDADRPDRRIWLNANNDKHRTVLDCFEVPVPSNAADWHQIISAVAGSATSTYTGSKEEDTFLGDRY